MKKSKAVILLVWVVLLAFGSGSSGDTFRHRLTNEVLHGYSTGLRERNNTLVRTQEKGLVDLNLVQWRVTPDRQGRNNTVVVMTIEGSVMLQIETKALTEALVKAAAQGPLFILLEIDTPGGRVDYTKQICGTITQIEHCPIYAFVDGSRYGGALSAGAAVAFACDRIYMAGNTSIGAAATVGLSSSGPKDFKDIYGEAVANKVSSAWRTYLASLAEQNERPGLLAGAMVDEGLEVIEVTQDEKRLFIDPVNKTPEQQLVHTWSKKGSLLTLTGEQAAKCGIADKVVKSRVDILRLVKADGAELVIDDCFQEAGQQFKRAKKRFNKISAELDLKIKRMKETQVPIRSLKMLRDIRKGYKSLLTLAKRYPDLRVDVRALERQLNTADALYKEGKPPR
ncbi:MAG: hypothetical protein ACYTEL_02165 [Planctomycetota bacterium]|jgi:ClpP class serine protease